MTIRLDPELFGALHLSSLAFGGIGGGALKDRQGNPLCAIGHAEWIARGPTSHLDFLVYPMAQPEQWLRNAGFTPYVADGALVRAGVRPHSRIPFEEWCEVVGVDVTQ